VSVLTSRLKASLLLRDDSGLRLKNIGFLRAALREEIEASDREQGYLERTFLQKTVHELEIRQIAESVKCLLDCKTLPSGKVSVGYSARS
jgi:hypothetical protein